MRDLEPILILDHVERFEYGRHLDDDEKNQYLGFRSTTMLGAIRFVKDERKKFDIMKKKDEIALKKQKAREEYEKYLQDL